MKKDLELLQYLINAHHGLRGDNSLKAAADKVAELITKIVNSIELEPK